MKRRKVKYTEEHISKIKVVPDFLPNSKHLVFKKEIIKVNLTQEKSKKKAKKK